MLSSWPCCFEGVRKVVFLDSWENESLLMVFHFSANFPDLSSEEKIRSILRLAFEHASTLASFATIYKVNIDASTRLMLELIFYHYSFWQTTTTILSLWTQWSTQFLIVSKSFRWSLFHLNGVLDKSASWIITRVWGWFCANMSVGFFNWLMNSSPHWIFSYSHILILHHCNEVDGPTPGVVPTSVAGKPERPYHALLAGAAGGYIVWGKYSSVNYQIVLYLSSRIFIGMSKRFWEKISPREYRGLLQHPKLYSLLSAAVWGIAMVLFEETPHVLHRSLKTSMDEIYRYQISSISSYSATEDDGQGDA